MERGRLHSTNGKWNTEVIENCSDGCPRVKNVDENKSMNKKLHSYYQREDHKVESSMYKDKVTSLYI